MPYTPDGTWDSREIQIVCVNTVLVILSVSAIVLRVWARRIQQVAFYADDWIILVAWLLALGVNATLYYSIHTGIGRHADTLSLAQVQGYLLNLYIIQMLWNTALPLIKLSILLFLKRIFTNKTMKYACYGFMAYLAAWYIAFQFTAIFQCTPLHHYWLRITTTGTCVPFVPFVISLATTNLASDVGVMILPVREIWKLQMRTTQKIGLSCTFAVSFVIVAIAIVRINELREINTEDITWSDTYAHLWTAIETSLGIVVACLPHLMPVYRKMRGITTTVASYEDQQRDASAKWRSNQEASFPYRSVYSSARHDSNSEPDKEKLEEYEYDSVPKNSIGVRTHIEARVENIGDVESGHGHAQAIPMHTLS